MGLKTDDTNTKKSDGLAILLEQQEDSLDRNTVSISTKAEELNNALKYIFNFNGSLSLLLHDGNIDYRLMESTLSSQVDRLRSEEEKTTCREGCLGPEEVGMDLESAYGHFYLTEDEDDSMTVESRGNFSSCRATNCFFSNSWMYEVVLHTSGIQQIGWATLSCEFTQEEGVGDGKDSYAFDGSRVKKWSIDPINYGQPWAPGDVIGCCADLDRGEITFYRNGKSLGIAFENISVLKPHLGFFPGISLSNGERCTLNFGGKPFFHPIEKFHPCQSPPSDAELQLIKYLMGCLERLAEMSTSIEISSPAGVRMRLDSSIDEKILMGSMISERLYPYLRKDYHLVKFLIPCLRRLLGKVDSQQRTGVVPFLELLAGVLGKEEFTLLMRRIYEQLATYCCVSPFRSAEVPFTASYPHLSLLIALLKFPLAQEVFLNHPRFHYIVEKCLTRKIPTDEDLKDLLPTVWWKGCKDESMTEDIMISVITTLSNAFRKIEEMQFDLLLLIFVNPSSGSKRSVDSPGSSEFNENLFLQFANYLLSKNSGATRNIKKPKGLSDSTVMCSFFNFLMKLVRPYFVMQKMEENSALSQFPVEDLFMKEAEWLPRNALNELPRLGGLYTSLMKEKKEKTSEKSKKVFVVIEPDMFPSENTDCILPRGLVPKLFHILLLCYRLGVDSSIKTSLQQFQTENSTRSGLIKMENRVKTMELNEEERERFNVEIQKSRKDLIKIIRQSVWSKIVWFTSTKQKSIFLFSVYLSKLMLSISQVQDSEIFQFIPEVYIEASLDLFQALVKMDPRFGSLLQLEIFGLQNVFSFLIQNFNSPLIINPQINDCMIQTLATIFSDKELLRACERNQDAKLSFIPSLLKAFDTRRWLSVTNIFLSIGKGTGFGHGSSSSGSPVFRDLFISTCQLESHLLTDFLNRLFNTLNVTLTEMVITFGEWAQMLDHATSMYNSLMLRQPRKASCFYNFSVNLLRLLEFVAHQIPTVFLNGSTKLNLVRVVEVIGYVLSHTTQGPDSTPFNTILNTSQLSGQDSKFRISRLSILAPVAGIMVSLHSQESLYSSKKFSSGNQHSVVKMLAEELVCPIEAVHSLTEVDWKPSFSNIHKTKCIPKLKELIKAFDQSKKEIAQQMKEEKEMVDVPEEFLDPILMTVMKDPVILPDSKVVVDRETIERNLLTNPRDPFSRAPLTVEMLQSDHVLKERIRKWTIDEKSAN